MNNIIHGNLNYCQVDKYPLKLIGSGALCLDNRCGSDSESIDLCLSLSLQANPINTKLSTALLLSRRYDSKYKLDNNHRGEVDIYKEGLKEQLCRFHQRGALDNLVEHCCREKQ